MCAQYTLYMHKVQSIMLQWAGISLKSAGSLTFFRAMASITRKIINTPDAPAAIGAYSQAVQIDYMLYMSGQIGLDPKTGNFVSDDVVGQTEQVLKNMRAILSAAGTTEQNVIKTTVLLANIEDFSKVDAVYAKFFGANRPARAAFQAAALPKAAKVEIEAIAAVGNITTAA